MRFLSRGRAFTDDENRVLAEDPPVTGADYDGASGPSAAAPTSSPRQSTPVRYLVPRRAAKPLSAAAAALSSKA